MVARISPGKSRRRSQREIRSRLTAKRRDLGILIYSLMVATPGRRRRRRTRPGPNSRLRASSGCAFRSAGRAAAESRRSRVRPSSPTLTSSVTCTFSASSCLRTIGSSTGYGLLRAEREGSRPSGAQPTLATVRATGDGVTFGADGAARACARRRAVTDATAGAAGASVATGRCGEACRLRRARDEMQVLVNVSFGETLCRGATARGGG